MQIELNYGRDKRRVELPDDLQVTLLRKPAMPVLPDPQGAVLQALANPVKTAPLIELARTARSAVIAICDITRPVPNALFLRPLIERLMEGGITARNILVLVATGLHRPNLDAELETLIVDPLVLQMVPVENHYARNDEDHVLEGTTKPAAPVESRARRFDKPELTLALGL